MTRKTFALLLVVGLFLVWPLTAAHALSTFLAETETRLYKPEKSYNGYFMPTNNGAGATHFLMDLWGNVVHKWDAYPAGVKANLAVPGIKPEIHPDGTLWSGGLIQDWDGNVLWEFYPPRDVGISVADMPFHHDMKRIWNKKLNQWTQLIVSNRNRTKAEADAAGGDPSVSQQAYGTRLQATDYIIEVSMDKKIVWLWDFMDHTCQSVNPSWPRYVADPKDAPGKFDVHWMTDNQRPNGQAGFVRDWVHVNSVDFDEETGHVVINPKHFSDFIVVDHDKTFVSTTDFSKNIAAAAGPDGDIIYRWGNPSSWNAGQAPGWMTEGHSQMYGSHNIQFIRPYHWYRPKLSTDKWPDPATYTKSGVALPGAGNFLIYDNGCYNPAGMRSRVLEINGRIGASGQEEVPKGQYIWPNAAGYKLTGNNLKYNPSKQLVWSYASSTQHSFYSSHISGCQRLPNGNTSIMAGNQGQCFEVTPSGEVVWEYLYPATTVTMPDGSRVFGAKTVASDGNNAWQEDTPLTKGSISIFRHQRYGEDFPAFTGKDLTPQGTLTGRLPRLVGSTDQYPEAVTYYGFGIGGVGTVGGGGAGGAGGGSGGGGGY